MTDEANKLPKQELRRFFNICSIETVGLKPDDIVGFTVGFRMYERMAMKLGKQITEEESRRFVPAPAEPTSPHPAMCFTGPCEDCLYRRYPCDDCREAWEQIHNSPIDPKKHSG